MDKPDRDREPDRDPPDLPDWRLEATVEGLCQGVGFRVWTKRWAVRLGLVGRAENRPDGTVLVVAQGPRESLARLEACLSEGPPGAAVTAVHAAYGPPEPGLEGFGVV